MLLKQVVKDTLSYFINIASRCRDYINSPVQFRHQQIVVFHAQGELLHVDVVDRTIGRTQEQKGT